MLFRMTIWTIKISRTCCNQIVQWWDWLIRNGIYQMMFAEDDDGVDKNMNLSPAPSPSSSSSPTSHRCHDHRHIIMIIVVMMIVTLSSSSLSWSLSHYHHHHCQLSWSLSHIKLTRKGVAGVLDKSRLHSARGGPVDEAGNRNKFPSQTSSSRSRSSLASPSYSLGHSWPPAGVA